MYEDNERQITKGCMNNTAQQNHARQSRFPPFNNGLSEDEEVVKKFADTLQYEVDTCTIGTSNPKEREMLHSDIFILDLLLDCLLPLLLSSL